MRYPLNLIQQSMLDHMKETPMPITFSQLHASTRWKTETELLSVFNPLLLSMGRPPNLDEHYANVLEEYWGDKLNMMIEHATAIAELQHDTEECWSSRNTNAVLYGGYLDTHRTTNLYWIAMSLSTGSDLRKIADWLGLSNTAALLLRPSCMNMSGTTKRALVHADWFYNRRYVDCPSNQAHDPELCDWIDMTFSAIEEWLELTKYIEQMQSCTTLFSMGSRNINVNKHEAAIKTQAMELILNHVCGGYPVSGWAILTLNKDTWARRHDKNKTDLLRRWLEKLVLINRSSYEEKEALGMHLTHAQQYAA